MDKLPVSAIVVGLNEGHLLDACLSSIFFCDEILYYDLGSDDYSTKIADSHGASVVQHEKVDYVEIIHQKYYLRTKHDWILITDPDEVVDASLGKEIIDLFSKNTLSDNIGAVLVPCHFYFRKRKLNGTVWGGTNKRLLLANNKRFEFKALLHAGRNMIPPFQSMEIKDTGNNCIHHYWMQSYKQLFNKHKRYLKNEGETRYNSGKRTNFRKIAIEPLKRFHECFVIKKGYLDGFDGFFLSLFWAWYNIKALISLHKYQKLK